MGRLEGKVALISGGARGLGAAESRLFAREGSNVVIGDLLDDDGRLVEEEIRSSGGHAIYVHLDVTKGADWRLAVEAAGGSYGKLDVLVNNAGIFLESGIEDTTEEEWDRVMSVNVKGVFLGTRAAIPAMRNAGGGSIIDISSTGGLIANSRGYAAYIASKGAVRLFAKVTAMLHAKDNIRCNSLHPGLTRTPMTQHLLESPGFDEPELVPLGRIGTPQDIAYGALYLASDESSFVTGSELVVDGGATAQ